MNDKGTIIAFGAHHDDIELRAGGTIAKYVCRGYNVIYVVMIDSVSVSNNFKGSEKLSHVDILNLRARESQEGASILGTREPIFFNLKPSYYWTPQKGTDWRVHFNDDDEELFNNMKKFKGRFFCLEASFSTECVLEVANFIKKYNPEVILTQQANDFHPEHYAISTLVFAACRKLMEEGMDFKLYAWEVGGYGNITKFVPDIIIDVTDTFDIKVEALKPFISQQGNDSEIHIRHAKASAEYWGEKIGVKYAEPFSEILIARHTGGFLQTYDDFVYSSYFLGIENVRTQL